MSYKQVYWQLAKRHAIEYIAAWAASLCLGALYFLPLYLVNVRHFALPEVGLIVGCFGFGTLIGGFFAGWICDKFSAYKIATAALLLSALTVILLPAFQTVLSLCIILTALGLCNNSFTVANLMDLLNTSQFERLPTINLRRLAINSGIGISALLAGWHAANQYGYVSFFFGIGGFMLVMAILLALKRPNPPSGVVQRPTERTTQREDFKVALVVLSVVFMVGLMLAQLRTTYGLYLEHNGHLHALAISHIFLFNSILIVILQLPMVVWMTRLHPSLLTGISAFCIGIGFGCLAVWHSLFGALATCILWSAGIVMFFTVTQVYLYNRVPERYRGRCVGAYQVMFNLSMMFGPNLGSWLYTVHIKAVWVGSAFLGLLSLLLCIWLYAQSD